MNYKYSKRLQGDITKLDVNPMPDWEDFNDFVSVFLEQEAGTLVESDYGMDRHQVRYQVGASRYVLQYEHYSQSIWLEQDF